MSQKTAAGLLNLLDWVSEEVSAEMTVLALRTFLYVATRGTCTQKDLEKHMGVANATASRNVSYWTDRRFDRQPGVGFIDREEDDYDRRIRNLRLNAKGKAFYEKLRERL
jgi:DNA-binding MarR family transcriptional regulator